MDWGNAIIRTIKKSPEGDITHIEMDLHLAGDFKATDKKITWLAKPSSSHPLIQTTLLDYDYLVQKRKLEKDDSIESIKNPQSEFAVGALADANVLELKERDIIQFERKGYFILDTVEGEEGARHLKFIRIPDGRAAGLALKTPGVATTSAISSTADGAPSKDIDYSEIKMYKVDPVNQADKIEYPKGMYKVNSVYVGNM